MSKTVKTLHIEVHANIGDNIASMSAHSNRRAVPPEIFKDIKEVHELKPLTQIAIYNYILDNHGKFSAQQYKKLRSKHPHYTSAANAVSRAIDTAITLYGLWFLEDHRHKAKKRKKEAETAAKDQSEQSILEILSILKGMEGEIRWKFAKRDEGIEDQLLVIWNEITTNTVGYKPS